MSGPKNALAAWGSSALRAVELPTGTLALLRLPNVAALVAANAFPQELRILASKYATSGIEVDKLKPEELGRFLAFTYDLIARALRYMAPEGSKAWLAFVDTGESPEAEGWQPVSLTGAQIAEMDIDQDDLDALGKIVGRQVTVNTVTLSSRIDRGMVARPEPVDAVGGDETIDAFAPFRGQPGSSERGTDSEDVRPATIRSARHRRSGGRVRR